MNLDELEPIFPLHFFQLEAFIQKASGFTGEWSLDKSFLVTNLSELLDEEAFGKIYLAWNEKGIALQIDFSKPFEDCFYPDLPKGDGIEVFFDTRCLPSTQMGKYTHHFIALPAKKEGIQVEEVTKLKYDEQRDLAQPSQISYRVAFQRRSYSMYLFFPKGTLFGYDPKQFKQLGFNILLHRYRGEPQHFAFSKKQYKSMLNPKLWARLQLKD